MGRTMTLQTFLRTSSLAAVMLLAACGENDNSDGTIAVVPGVSSASPGATATPAPTPTPAATTPTPTTAVPVPTLTTMGNLTWSISGDVPAEQAAAVKDAMDWAVNVLNTLGAYTGKVPVTYNAGTATADASFEGRIQFGGAISRRVALHELAHWFGSGTLQRWVDLVSDGRFTGSVTAARVKAYDGDNAVMNASAAGGHFWPYGFNYDNEFMEPQRNVSLVSAQRADMNVGLNDGVAAIAGNRRFLNRSSQFVLEGSAAAGEPLQGSNGSTAAQVWQISYDNGFIVLTNSASNLAIDAMNGTADGDAVAMITPSSVASQRWEIVPTDNGWFLLRNRSTGKCLDNVADQSVGARIRVWSCGGHPNQQWHLIS